MVSTYIPPGLTKKTPCILLRKCIYVSSVILTKGNDILLHHSIMGFSIGSITGSLRGTNSRHVLLFKGSNNWRSKHSDYSSLTNSAAQCSWNRWRLLIGQQIPLFSEFKNLNISNYSEPLIFYYYTNIFEKKKEQTNKMHKLILD